MTIKRTLLAFAFALAFSLSAFAQTADGPDSKKESAAATPGVLRGSWQCTVTPEAGGPPPFLALFTFTSEGSVVETDAGPPTPLQFSTGHGEWKPAPRGNDIYVTYTQLQFDASQNLEGLFRGRMTVRVNRTETQSNGNITVDFFDTGGHLLFSANGKIACSRLPVLGADHP